MAVVQVRDDLPCEAARMGDVAGLEAILKQHPEQLNAIPNDDFATPLHVAVWLAEVECVELLLRYGADPNKRSSDRSAETCLQYVIRSLQYENGNTRAMVARMLIDAGADVTAKCSNSAPVPALKLARKQKSPCKELIEVLEKYPNDQTEQLRRQKEVRGITRFDA